MSPDRLSGSVYRYWCAHALAHLIPAHLGRREIDFLDAGGRDGHVLTLLASLGFTGRYTCLDLEPAIRPGVLGGFSVETIRSAFQQFEPPRQYDAVLFESSLECVEDYADISWLAPSLKPGGKVFVALVTRGARPLYPGFWQAGGRYYRDYGELEPAFEAIGLRMVDCLALVGLAGRLAQRTLQLRVGPFISAVVARSVGRLGSSVRTFDPVRPLNRFVNVLTSRLDCLLFPYRPVGHCFVLERVQGGVP